METIIRRIFVACFIAIMCVSSIEAQVIDLSEKQINDDQTIGKEEEEKGDHGNLVEDLNGAVQREACIKIRIEGVGEGEKRCHSAAKHGTGANGKGEDRKNKICHGEKCGDDH